MAQWIKNISTGRTSTLEDEGYKSLQDASNAGYSPITADSLKTETPFNLPTMQPEPNYQASISSIPTIESILNTTPTQTETAQEDMTSKYLKALEEYGGKQVAQIKAEETAGLPTYTKELTDVNAQIQALQKEALAIPLQMQEEAKGRGITAAGLSPLQSDRTRQNTIKALGLSSIAQTLQGNVALAQSQANKAVELEFAPLQAKIDYLKEALRLNEGKLTKEEAKQAKLQEIKLNERQALLDEQKKNKNEILGIAQEAASKGIDALTLQKIQNAKSIVEANEIYYLASTVKDMISKGYTKISSPLELAGLTELDITRMPNGDIYRNPVNVKTTKKTSNVPTTNIVSDENIKANTTADLTKWQEGDVVENNGKFFTVGTNGKWRTATADEKKTLTEGGSETPFKQIETNLLSVVGDDSFLSPDDYALAKADWIRAGGSAIDFDKKFANRRNPNNPYYQVSKATTNTSSSQTP